MPKPLQYLLLPWAIAAIAAGGCDRVPPGPAASPAGAGHHRRTNASTGTGIPGPVGTGEVRARPSSVLGRSDRRAQATILFDALDRADISGLAARITRGDAPVVTTTLLSMNFDDHALGALEPVVVHGPARRHGRAGKRIRARTEGGQRAFLGDSLRLTRTGGEESRARTPLFEVIPGHTYALTYRMAVYRYSHRKKKYQRKPRVGQPILELFDLHGLSDHAIDSLPDDSPVLQAARVEPADGLDPPGVERNITWMALGDTFRPGPGATHFRIAFAVTGVPLKRGQEVSAEVWYDDVVLTDVSGPPSAQHPIDGAPGYTAVHPLQLELQLAHPMRRNATEKRYGIYAPAPSTLSFDVAVPESAILRFGHGFLPELATGTGDVAFVVTLTDEAGEHHTLYEWKKPLEARLDHWIDAEVDLKAFAGQRVRLALETRGRPPGDTPLLEALSRAPEGGMVWSFPVLDNPRAPGKTVVLVVWDTVPASATSLGGNHRRDITPRLEQLAAMGTTFDRALVPSSWTLPSFASMLTGVPPLSHRAGELDPQTIRGKKPLPRSVVTLASRLRRAGWETRAWINNPYLMHHFGLDRGFSTYIDYDAREAYRASDKAVAQAIDYLSAPRGHDRFVFFHFMDAHGPYLPHPEYRERFARMYPSGKIMGESLGAFYRSILLGRITLNDEQKKGYRELYDAVVAYTDHQTGRLFDALPRSPGGDTLFIVTADHGEEFWEHDHYEHGHTLYDELLHVPLVIAAMGEDGATAAAGHAIASPVSLEDLAPTILAYAGVDERPLEDLPGRSNPGAEMSRAMDTTPAHPVALSRGKSGATPAPVPHRETTGSLLPALFGEDVPAHRTFFSAFTLYGHQRLGLERDGWKLLYNQKGLGRPSSRSGEPIAPIELYDLRSDPGETRNLASRRPNLVAAYLNDLAARYLDAQKGRLVLLFLGDSLYRSPATLTVTVRLDQGPRWKKKVHDLVWPAPGVGSETLEVHYREARDRSQVSCTFTSWKALLAFEPAIGSGPALVRIEPDAAVEMEVVTPDGTRRSVVRGPELVAPERMPLPLSSYLEQDLRDNANRTPRLVILYDVGGEEDGQENLGEDASRLEAQLKALGYVE